MTNEEENKMNAAAMIKANDDKHKAFDKDKLLTEQDEVVEH